MQEKHDIGCGIMHGFDWTKWTSGTASQRLSLIPAGQEHVLQQDDGKNRFTKVVIDLSRLFALCAASDEAMLVRDDLAFFQAIKAQFAKTSGTWRSFVNLYPAPLRQTERSSTSSRRRD